MDADEREFFKSMNKGKKYNKETKGQEERPQTHFNPMQPFTNVWPEMANSMSSKSGDAPVLPIQLNYTGTTWQWYNDGHRVRNCIKGRFWIQENGECAWTAFEDYATKTITKLTPLDIRKDGSGRRFVEVVQNGNNIRTYIEDALNVCFKGKRDIDKSSSSISTVTEISETATEMVDSHTGNVKKRNVTIFEYCHNQYGYFPEGKFCVSYQNGLAAWMWINWKDRTYSRVIPYAVRTRPNGSKYVSVKQEDGTYKDFELDIAVCTTFNGRPSIPDAEVRHIDGNLGNCDASNLEWI